MNNVGTLTFDSSDLSFIGQLKQDILGTKHNADAGGSLTKSMASGNANVSGNTSQVVLAPPKASIDLMLILQTLQVKLDEEGIKKGKEDALNLAAMNKERHKEVMEALQKSIEAIAKSKKSGLFGKIFGWIAAAATLVAGALLIATGAGAIAGGIMMALAVDQMIGMATGKSAISELTSVIAKGLASVMDEPANTIVATVIVTAIIIAATAGAGSLAASSKAAGTVSTASTYMVQAKNVSLTVAAFTQVGGATSNMVTAGYQKDSSDAQAEEAEIRKVISQNKARIEDAIEHMKNLTQNSESTLSQMVNYINQEQQTNQTLIRNMA